MNTSHATWIEGALTPPSRGLGGCMSARESLHVDAGGTCRHCNDPRSGRATFGDAGLGPKLGVSVGADAGADARRGRCGQRPAPALASRSRGGPPCQSRHRTVASSRSSPPDAATTARVSSCTASRGCETRRRQERSDVDAGRVALEHAVGAGQQSALDLRLQRQRHRALSPLVEVGEPPVGEHDVGQRVRASATAASARSSGRSSRRSSSTPTASPRLVTGANSRVPASSSSNWMRCSASARPCGVPTNGTASEDLRLDAPSRSA
jgi:hypothetical protein